MTNTDTLRRAAAAIRDDGLTDDPFMRAVAVWFDAEAEAHVHVPGSDRTRSLYDMPGMDTAPAVRAARAFLFGKKGEGGPPLGPLTVADVVKAMRNLAHKKGDPA